MEAKTTVEHLSMLRTFLVQKGLKAFIIPSTDPHLSEYVAPHWMSREWISGFTGSAGTAVILQGEGAGLWTDSRYFLQATEQLKGTGIDLYKEMLPETPSIAEYLCNKLEAGDKVGVDGKMFSITQFESLQQQLQAKNIQLVLSEDPMDTIWKGREPIPQGHLIIYSEKYAGMGCDEKLAAIHKYMEAENIDFIFLSALDEIAWTLNLRGNDVHCNPVFVSYLLIGTKRTILFIDYEKITPEVADYFELHDIETVPYQSTEKFLTRPGTYSIMLNPQKTNYAIFKSIPPTCHIVRKEPPVALMKSIRNTCEIAGLHQAMTRDGVALVKFLYWLNNALAQGTETELSVEKKLHDFRSAQDLFVGDSFDTITGYKEHAAIVHYESSEATNVKLQPEGFLLIDSGAQYLDGTTDITRTIALGSLSEEEKLDYTLVLKGHIDLACAVFPAGTRGTQLDVLARMPMWQHHMNFLHGTGHGVGHYLSVHEGPQSIRMNENPVTLQPGMVTSNEPGIYKEGSHGIRIENLTLVKEDGEGLFGNYLCFETVTLCPICKEGILTELLTQQEKDWLNSYHQKVYETLSDLLDAPEREWLRQATSAL